MSLGPHRWATLSLGLFPVGTDKYNLASPENKVLRFFLNVIFEQNTLMCTTGYALETFSMDKTAEFDWDNWVIAFFHELKIAVTKQ